jgi:imidazolonepropionase-like amidohydrolase
MATLYVGGRLFDGEKVQDGHAVLEESGKVKRVAPAGEFAGFAGEKVDTAGGTLIPGIIDCHVIRCRAPKAIPASCKIA